MGDFEQIPEIAERIKRSKMELQDNGNYWAPEWDSQSCCDQDFVNNFKKGWQHQQAIIDEHTEVIKLQDTDLRKYEKQIENLKEQLNNMEQCYIGKKKELDELQKTNISLEAGLRKNSKNKQKLLGKNIELQKRIDGAVAMLTGVCGKVFIGDVVDTLRGAND